MILNFIKVAKVALVVPAAVSSLWFVKHRPSAWLAGGWLTRNPFQHVQVKDVDADTKKTIEILTIVPGVSGSSADVDSDEARVQESVSVRRAKVAAILKSLDRVAEVTLQMDPDRAASLEPVVLDLAEQAVELGNEAPNFANDPGASRAADLELGKIEKTVRRLRAAVQKTVGPEVSL